MLYENFNYIVYIKCVYNFEFIVAREIFQHQN